VRNKELIRKTARERRFICLIINSSYAVILAGRLSFDACSGADQGGPRAGEHRGKMICRDSTTRRRRLENHPAMVDNERRDPASGE
jgi:hypothetical protein